MTAKNIFFITFASFPLLALFSGCLSPQKELKKLAKGSSVGLIYENGSIVTENIKQNYGGNTREVKLINRYPEKIPQLLHEISEPLILGAIRKNLPEVQVELITEPPRKEVRTVKGKIYVVDYSALKESMILFWRYQITYSCTITYYMENCPGSVELLGRFRRKDGKEKEVLLHRFKLPLAYIKPQTENVEEVSKIAEVMRVSIEPAIDRFFQDQ